jgi:hypothetical protein
VATFRTLLREHRPAPAMVVASIALLVALGGTSMAAVVNVPLLSVGTPQLKSNAVISAKVKNRSLLAVDFKKGQLPKGPRGPQGPAGPSGVQGPAGAAAPGYVAQVVSQSSATATTTTTQTFQELPGATENAVVPAGETARLYVMFSAESTCFGGTGSCSVRITVDGNELMPVEGATAFFDSTDAGDEGTNSPEAHAIVRLSETLSAGTHTVKVERRTTQVATTLRLDDWALVIFRTKLS